MDITVRGKPDPAFSTLTGQLPSAEQIFATLLEPAERLGVERIHVESDGEGYRLRYRHDDILSSERLACDDPRVILCRRLDEALLAVHANDPCADSNGTFRCFRHRRRNGWHRVGLDTCSTNDGPSWVFTLHGPHSTPPRLDELVTDHDALHAIRASLQARSGWLAIASGHVLDGQRVVRAMAQELARPSHKLVCLEPQIHPPLALVEQLPSQRLTESFDAMDADVLLCASAPADAMLHALAASAAESLLVVHRIRCRRASEVLRRYVGLGLSPAWIAMHLNGVVMRYRSRTLCTECRVRDTKPDQVEAMSHSASPDGLSSWLKRSLEIRYRAGEGCESCRGSGHSGFVDITDFIRIDEATRTALLRGDTGPALCRVDDSQRLTNALGDHVSNGTIASSEACKHLIARY